MKKQAEIRDDNRIEIIPEYGRQKLLTYAESFRDLADLFEEEEAEQEQLSEPPNRQEYLWQRKLQENQGLLAEHLKEMAHIMAKIAKETCRCRPMGERRFKQMSRLLRESGIQLKNFFEMEHEDGHWEISLTMRNLGEKRIRAGESEHISTEDVADFISVAMNTRLCPSKNSPMYLTKEYNTYYFLEEPPYHLLTGFAKAVKEGEKMSGDNYSFYEADTGKLVVILSDGMGSGEMANRDSGRVIEMMERLFQGVGSADDQWCTCGSRTGAEHVNAGYLQYGSVFRGVRVR